MLTDSSLPSKALWLCWAGDGHILHSAVVVSLQYRVSWSFPFDALTGELERTLEPVCCVLRVFMEWSRNAASGNSHAEKEWYLTSEAQYLGYLNEALVHPQFSTSFLPECGTPFLWSGSVLHLPWKLFHVHLLSLQKLNSLLFGFMECFKTFLEGSRSWRQTLSVSLAYFQLLPLVSLLPAHLLVTSQGHSWNSSSFFLGW